MATHRQFLFLPVAAMFLNGSGQMSNLHRGFSIDASYQVSTHLAKQCQRRRFLEIVQSETSKLKLSTAKLTEIW
jgi:hypothetical protein